MLRVQVLDSILHLGEDVARLSIGGADMDIGQWLNGIGLGQYEALFREHEIDAEVLPDLTEADLEKIGVPLGHRKKLIRAIAGLAANPLPPAAKPARRGFACVRRPRAPTPSGGRSR